MNELEIKDPKQRILLTAACLFAKKSFSAVGVREIASQANVNISMISYYYGSKSGILKAIIEEYFCELKVIIETLPKANFEKGILTKNYVHGLVNLIRRKEDLCKVAILELPYDVPEIIEFKISMLEELMKFAKTTFHGAHAGKKMVEPDPILQMIIGPAFIGLVFSHFLLGGMKSAPGNIPLDDSFYEKYSEVISTIFLDGVRGIAKKSDQQGLPVLKQCLENQAETIE